MSRDGRMTGTKDFLRESRAAAVVSKAWLSEAEEQLDFGFPAKYRPGLAKRILLAIAQRHPAAGRQGEEVPRSTFRRVVGQHLAKAVYVWQEDSDWEGRLVVELSISQGGGWRNLQGAPLYINGRSAGTVSYDNPFLRKFS